MSAHELRNEAVAVARLLASLREEGIVETEEDEDLAMASETRVLELAESVLLHIMDLEAQENATEALIQAIGERKARLKERRERLKGTMLDAMQTIGRRKLSLALGTVSVVNGRAGVRIIDETELPEEFWRHPKPVPDVAAIGEALHAGGVVPGAELANGQPRLQVRR